MPSIMILMFKATKTVRRWN